MWVRFIESRLHSLSITFAGIIVSNVGGIAPGVNIWTNYLLVICVAPIQCTEYSKEVSTLVQSCGLATLNQSQKFSDFHTEVIRWPTCEPVNIHMKKISTEFGEDTQVVCEIGVRDIYTLTF